MHAARAPALQNANRALQQVQPGSRPARATHARGAGQVASRPSFTRVTCRGQKEEKLEETARTGAGLKAVWYAAEAFGKLVGGNKAAASEKLTEPIRKMSREEIEASLKADYEVNYFVSGLGSMEAYAKDCVFADPFVAFKGTERFKQNVSNLGGMMRDIQLDLYDWKDDGPERIVTKWRFSCVLDLPWQPLLAAGGSTEHIIDLESGRVVKHVENWDVEPGKVVGQLFKPAPKARLDALAAKAQAK